MNEITPKQQELVDFIETFQHQNGFPPTIRDMQLGLDLSSPALVQSRLDYLEKAGRISRLRGQPRTVQVIRPS